MAEVWRMPSHMKNVVNIYKTLTKIPNCLGGQLDKTGSRISSKWSIRNIDRGTSTQYYMEFKLSEHLEVISKTTFAVDVSHQLFSSESPQGNFKAVIYEDKGGKDKKTFLEVWSADTLAHSIDLTALDIHGNVYGDSEFGSLEWSQDEKFLVYVAEKKPPKSEPFIKRKSVKGDNESDSDDKVTPGQEHLYRKDWGEQLTGKVQTVIVVCEVEAEKFTVLQGLPDTWCPGQVRFTPNGKCVVGVAWDTAQYRLGLIYCTNRPGYVFSLNINSGTFKKLSPDENISVRSPRVGPLGELVWLQRSAHGPHHACHQLVLLSASIINNIDNASDSEIKDNLKTVIDIVRTKRGDGAEFYGLYCLSLPQYCFSGRRVVFSTQQKFEVRSYTVDLDTRELVDISNNYLSKNSTSVTSARADAVVAVCSSLTTPPQLFVGRLGPNGVTKWNLVWGASLGDAERVQNATTEYTEHCGQDKEDSVNEFTSIYFAPAPVDGKKFPVVVWPHGGPHSAFSNVYSLEAAFFNMIGFSCLLINYRGSTGAGDDTVRFLPSRIGRSDVADCYHATCHAQRHFQVDGGRCVLYGGSHGGFLVTLLSGTYPDTFKAVVSRNPVIDVASMINTSDIPDCLECSSGLAVLRINYRGSTGAGDSPVRCLLGNAGLYDVADCRLALTHHEERAGGFEHTLLYGGSFGGFICAHLAGRFPLLFKAMSLRNPVIDMVSKENSADNPDGCAVEAGMEYHEDGPVSEDQLLALRRCSPIVHAHQVKAPTLLCLGSNDKRVPASQGLEYARRLRANGVTTRVQMYEDNHTLSSLPVEMDSLINAADWFITHMKTVQ